MIAPTIAETVTKVDRLLHARVYRQLPLCRPSLRVAETAIVINIRDSIYRTSGYITVIKCR